MSAAGVEATAGQCAGHELVTKHAIGCVENGGNVYTSPSGDFDSGDYDRHHLGKPWHNLQLQRIFSLFFVVPNFVCYKPPFCTFSRRLENTAHRLAFFTCCTATQR